MMEYDKKIYVAGHRGLVGSALVRALEKQGYYNLICADRCMVDLTNPNAVSDFFQTNKPDYVFLAAAKVGGIHANNSMPATFIYQNLQIQNNVIHAAWQHEVKRLMFMGSSCIYPKESQQPIKESALMTGPLEPTNRPYAIAKIAGIEMCWAYNRQYGTQYIAAMPTNLYGPNDNYDLNHSHVIPAIMRKMHEAKAQGHTHVTLWGTGKPRREFLHSDDLAETCISLMNLNDVQFSTLLSEKAPPIINIGCGEDMTIKALAECIANVVGYNGNIVFDDSMPDGVMKKQLDVERMRKYYCGYQRSIAEGIRQTYQEMYHVKALI